MKNKQVIAFDMDDTLTDSRSLISDKMQEELKTLCLMGKEIVIVSGASLEQMIKQIPWLGEEGCPAYILSQSGNILTRFGNTMWERKMDWWQQLNCMEHATRLMSVFGVPPSVEYQDLVENRGCQITYSAIGAHAPLDKKREFDPGRTKRKRMLSIISFDFPGLVAKIAGTTSIDYTFSDGTKGDNIEKLRKLLKRKKSECLYVGDALYPGGNDESVVGVWDTIEVGNPEDTYQLIINNWG